MKTSDGNTPTKLRRIFPGIYCDREKHQIEVIMVSKNIDIGEKRSYASDAFMMSRKISLSYRKPLSTR